MNFQPENEVVGEDDIYRIKAAETKQKRQLIVSVLSNIKGDENAVQFLQAKCVEEEWLINAFFKLGKATIEQHQYLKTKIEKLLLQAEQEEAKQKLESREFLLDMKNEFEAETGSDLYIPVKNVLDRISYLLECYGITYSRYGNGKKNTMCKLSTSFIEHHFDTILSNRGGAKIKLNRFKDELFDKQA